MDFRASAHDPPTWSEGHRGKFVIDSDGVVCAWAVSNSGDPHHAMVTERFGIRSAVEGDIAVDGKSEVLARDPRANIAALLRKAAGQANALGIRLPTGDADGASREDWDFG
jgi:hypothetical protein